MYINDVKFACATCIKGHRSSHCNHADRQLFEIKKKGRPVTQCSHCRDLRKQRQIHVKCICMDRFATQSEPATASSSSSDMEHTPQCTCKRAKKKSSLPRPANNPSLMAIDVSRSTSSSRGTPSPPTSTSPYLHEPTPWPWALIAPTQDNIDIDSRHNHLSTNENSDYSFVFHTSADEKNQKQRRRSSLSSRSSLIHTANCPHQLARASSSDSSVKSEPVMLSDGDGNSFALFSGSPDNQPQNQLSNSDPLGSKAIFPSDLDNETATAAGSLGFSFDLTNDLAMLIDEKQSMPSEAEDLKFPVSSTSSVSGEFTDELTNTLTFDSAAELMAIFDSDLSQPLPPVQQPPPQLPKHTHLQPSNQSCCGSFAPSSVCYNDSSLPAESVYISITRVGGVVSNQQQPTTRIVTCRCGSSCACSGCLVHAGGNWLSDPYTGVPSSGCSSEDEDMHIMDEATRKPALQWLNNTTPEPM